MKKIILFKLSLLIFILFVTNIFAQSNHGTEFFLTFLPGHLEGSHQVNEEFLILYITSKEEALVKVEIKSKGYSEEKLTIPNDIIYFRFSPTIAQPYVKFERDLQADDKIYTEAAIHITSTQPISIIALSRQKYTTDGYLALPVEMLSQEYIISSYASIASGRWPSQVAIVAPFDDTIVDFVLGGNELTTTMNKLKPGETQTEILNQGDVWLISTDKIEFADLSGSKITANKPVSVISGHYCAAIPIGVAACDYLTAMEVGTDYWGNDVIVPNIFNRKKGSILKIYAKEENTNVYRNGELIGNIQTSGGVEGTGFFHVRSTIGENKPVIISGDKPIGVTLYNTGFSEDNIPTDPFQMNLTASNFFQYDILFSTPGIEGIETFDENYVALVFSSTDGLIPDHFQFAYQTEGVLEWHQLNNILGHTNILYAGVLNEKSYFVKTIMLPEHGVYGIKADEAFMAYSYGNSIADSYGFPSNLSILSITKALIKASLNDFNTLHCDDFIDSSIKIDNTGDATLIISEINILGQNADDFVVLDVLPLIIGPGKSQNINIRFKPNSSGLKNAELHIFSNAQPDSIFILPISAFKENTEFITDVEILNFSYLSYNQALTKSFTLKNIGNIECTYILSSSDIIEISPDKVTLQPDEEVTINVYFAGSNSDLIIQEQISITDTICNIVKYIDVEGNVIDAILEIELSNISGFPGEIIEVPLILKELWNINLNKNTQINFELSYNSTLLKALDIQDEIVDEFISKITIDNITLTGFKTGDILTSIRFKVGLGNAEESFLELSNVELINSDIGVIYTNGIFTLLGVCYEGDNPRLLNPNSQAGILNIIPNPANEEIQIDFSLIEKGFTEIKILNYLGEIVKTIFSENVSKFEERSILVDLNNLAAGQYLIVFKTPTIIENRNLSVIR